MKKVFALILALAMILTASSFALAEELPTITVMFCGSNVTDDSAVLEAANEYIADKVGAKLEIVWGTWGDFDDKATNALTTGDSSIDMLFTSSWSGDEYNKFARDGYFVKLDDLIAEYGEDLVAALPESLMQAATVEGAEGVGIYAVNGFKDTATQNTWDVNVTLLEELGYTLEDFEQMSFYDFGELFAKAKEVKGDAFYPFLVEPVVLERMVTGSIIVAGDSNLLSLYLNQADVSAEGPYGNELLNKFATDEYKAFVEKMHEYYEAGYVDPSLAVAETSNDTRTNAQKTGDYLIGTQSYAFGYEFNPEVLDRGIEVAFVPCTDPYMDATVGQGAMMAISSASEHPVESFKFLCLLNTDPTLMTLLNYGVEGIHYTLDDDGLVVFDADARASYSPWTNGMGNVTILPDTADEGAGFRESFKEYYASAQAIPAASYIFNAAEVETEQAALSNVVAQYALALDAGALDPETALPEFLEALDAAGMQTYLDAANAQMEAYLAAQ